MLRDNESLQSQSGLLTEQGPDSHIISDSTTNSASPRPQVPLGSSNMELENLKEITTSLRSQTGPRPVQVVFEDNNDAHLTPPQSATIQDDHHGCAVTRMNELEQQLLKAQEETRFYKEQLVLQERTTQALVAEKEVEKAKLVSLVSKQDDLICALRQQLENNNTQQHLVKQVKKLREALNAMANEKRSLEQRMAAFLQDELDAAADAPPETMLLSDDEDELINSTLLGYRSSTEELHYNLMQQHLDLRRRSSCQTDSTDPYQLSVSLGSPSRRNSSSSSSAHDVHSSGGSFPINSTLKLVEEEEEEEDAVSRYSSLASTPSFGSFDRPRSVMPTMAAATRGSTSSTITTATTTTITTQSPVSSTHKQHTLSRIILPPATPPPNHPLPPIPSESSADNMMVKRHTVWTHRSFTPPPSSSFTSTHTHPLRISTTFNNTNDDKRPSSSDSLVQSPPSAPAIMSPSSISPTSSLDWRSKSYSSLDGNKNSSSSVAPEEQSRDKGGFWRGMRKKWIKGR